MNVKKETWQGRVVAVQPRIRLMRSFDQSSHSYLGYVLVLKGAINHKEEVFSIAIGKEAQAKHGFKTGDFVSGESSPVMDPQMETAGFYKTSKLKLVERTEGNQPAPPWTGQVVSLEEYRRRGCRRLDEGTYDLKCVSCVWGCKMPVEMTIDHWNPSPKKYRTETFCYGPKSCALYMAGPTRKVPGRKGMVFEEEDWVDEQNTSHREDDE